MGTHVLKKVIRQRHLSEITCDVVIGDRSQLGQGVVSGHRRDLEVIVEGQFSILETLTDEVDAPVYGHFDVEVAGGGQDLKHIINVEIQVCRVSKIQ